MLGTPSVPGLLFLFERRGQIEKKNPGKRCEEDPFDPPRVFLLEHALQSKNDAMSSKKNTHFILPERMFLGPKKLQRSPTDPRSSSSSSLMKHTLPKKGDDEEDPFAFSGLGEALLPRPLFPFFPSTLITLMILLILLFLHIFSTDLSSFR
jgi:hypothetical protein